MPQFVIQQNESGIWFYELVTDEESVLLTGTKHEFRQGCLGEVISVRMNGV